MSTVLLSIDLTCVVRNIDMQLFWINSINGKTECSVWKSWPSGPVWCIGWIYILIQWPNSSNMSTRNGFQRKWTKICLPVWMMPKSGCAHEVHIVGKHLCKDKYVHRTKIQCEAIEWTYRKPLESVNRKNTHKDTHTHKYMLLSLACVWLIEGFEFNLIELNFIKSFTYYLLENCSQSNEREWHTLWHTYTYNIAQSPPPHYIDGNWNAKYKYNLTI